MLALRGAEAFNCCLSNIQQHSVNGWAKELADMNPIEQLSDMLDVKSQIVNSHLRLWQSYIKPSLRNV